MGSTQTVVQHQQTVATVKTLYVLELQDSKYYVGVTKDVNKRLTQHKSGIGSEWTKLHPVKSLLSTKPVTGDFDEDTETKSLMKKYGIGNVRGGTYCQITLSRETVKFLEKEFNHSDDKCLGCGQEGHYVKYCPNREKIQSNHSDNKCLGCGQEGHYVKYCPNRAKAQLTSTSYPKQQSGICDRCGFTSHSINTCNAHSHKDGHFMCTGITKAGVKCKKAVAIKGNKCATHGPRK